MRRPWQFDCRARACPVAIGIGALEINIGDVIRNWYGAYPLAMLGHDALRRRIVEMRLWGKMLVRVWRPSTLAPALRSQSGAAQTLAQHHRHFLSAERQALMSGL
jgi:hypothetical protein